jgi:hypothetical protein
MIRKFKVHKTLGKSPILVKIERNENMANQIASHPTVPDPPHDKTEILGVTQKLSDAYTQHIKGDHEATIRMREQEGILDGYYWDMAEYVEVVANTTNDGSLPTSMGFEMYAERKPRGKKTFSIRDGNHSGEVFVEYPKLEGAAAYRAEIAEVIADKDPVFQHAGACSITFMVLQNVKPDTKFLIRLNGIFPSGEGPTSEAVPFRTKEWS